MPKTLLLADDSVTIQKVVGISFANEDIVLLTVDNGDDAVARAAEARPDIILADVVMPGKTGYEVCEAIKANPELSHIPVLLLTGTFEAFDEERASRVGAEGHITKPFEAQALVDQVNELLASAQPPAATGRPSPAEPESQAAPVPEPQAVAPETPPPVAPERPADASDLGSDRARAMTDDAYDFFDEGMDDAADSAAAAATVVMTDDFAATPSRGQTPSPEARAASAPAAHAPGDTTPPARPMGVPSRPDPSTLADETVAILPEAPSAAWSGGDDFGDALGSDDLGQLDDIDLAGPGDDDDLVSEDDLADVDLGSPTPTPVQPLAGGNPSEPQALDFDDDTSAPQGGAPIGLDTSDLARETLLDPAVARGYDVSSSDLGDSFAMGGSTPRPTPPVAEPPPPPTQPVLGERPDARAAAPEPRQEAAPPTAPPVPEPIRAVASEDVGGATPDLSPMMRERIHESLEKVAWEAFGDLSERVARQIVERVEAIAWEVIPQMAEALIQEEIRRLKGEGEE